MELKEFIKNTLHDITLGIRDGNKEIQTKNHSYVGDALIAIDFDISVASEENSATGGHGKITVASIISGGLSKEEKSAIANYSRIKFKVTMNYRNAGPESK